jgi:hypothetical protein
MPHGLAQGRSQDRATTPVAARSAVQLGANPVSARVADSVDLWVLWATDYDEAVVLLSKDRSPHLGGEVATERLAETGAREEYRFPRAWSGGSPARIASS